MPPHQAGPGRYDDSFHSWKGHRACIECRRKKTKCDMQQPVCGLCQRVGGSCTFPTKRKTPEFRRRPGRGSEQNNIHPQSLGDIPQACTRKPPYTALTLDLERLVNLLESRLASGPSDKGSSSQPAESRAIDSFLGDLEGPGSVESFQTGTPEQQPRENLDTATSATPTDASTDAGVDVASSQTSVQPVQRDPSWPEIPDDAATELINIYFNKIHAWLPLLHRPNFFARYMSSGTFDKESLPCITDPEALIFCGMFALAARHSSHSYFADVPARERGEQFAERAKEYYARLRLSTDGVTLQYLQGCLLLVNYLYASGPCHQAWILIGVCVRVAYDLDLCCMDEQEDDQQDSVDWSDLEQRRRAFWGVWEVDTFASLLSRRPSGINTQRIAVRLPVSDETWFKNEPVDSPLIHSRPTEAWKTLVDSKNQDERAWYLLVNYIMATAYQTAADKNKSQRDHDELVDSIACLSLAMHQRFGLETHPLFFTPETFPKCNWIIGMHLLLNYARGCLSVSTTMPAPGTMTCGRDLSRIIYHWHPEYVSLSHPFFAAALLPNHIYPSIHTMHPLDTSCNREMQSLMLSQYASIWRLGSLLLDLTDPSSDDRLRPSNRGPSRQVAIFFPRSLHQNGSPRANEQTKKRAAAAISTPISGVLHEISLESFDVSQQGENSDGTAVELNNLGDNTGHLALSSFDDHDDWGSRLQLDYLCDDNQHFNYLQL